MQDVLLDIVQAALLVLLEPVLMLITAQEEAGVLAVVIALLVLFVPLVIVQVAITALKKVRALSLLIVQLELVHLTPVQKVHVAVMGQHVRHQVFA